MPRPLVSIVMATFNRKHLLERSLLGYELQDFDNKEIEFVIIDDHSSDNTLDYVKYWSKRTKIPVTTVTTHPKEEAWRDCGAVLNAGIRASLGKHILLTHPEVIPGKKSVKRCVEALERFEIKRIASLESPIGLYACCRIYYLSPKNQMMLDSVEWQMDPLNVRKLPGFYDEDQGAPDFTHAATDMVAQPGSRLRSWESWVFGGCSRETWKRLGGMLETQKWGSVDVAFMQRRRAVGIANHTCPEDSTICIHQCHDLPDDVKTPRVENDWKEELKGVDFTNPGNLSYPGVDNLGW